ncbi:cell wall protein [Streptomyces meridianus]|uniref:cell wall protein n=1 Tax=Streptomyces meridianus TaxID=2938945 RepID=UPI002557EA15|nr:cell wall protein [Streptomyces meridianus]
MKLRHALAAAVATAALAPAALLAAPAAHAEGEQPAATQTSTGNTGSETTTPAPADGPAPEDTGEQTGSDASSDTTDGTAADGSGDAAESDEKAESGETGGDGGTGPGTGDGADDGSDTDPGDDSDCAIDAADLKVQVVGLPSKLVAGGGWSNFSVKLTNTTDHALDEVYPIIYAAPLEDVDHPRQLLRMQYRDPGTGKWTRFSEWTQGQYFGMFELDAHMTAELELRIRATDRAGDGDGIALVAGDYYNEDDTCGWSEEEWYEFSILAAGADPGDDVPPAEPGKPGKPVTDERPGKNVKPQGGMKELPVKGNLAETGASSVLPLFALSGAAAVALGAGAAYAVRRRRTDDTGAAA